MKKVIISILLMIPFLGMAQDSKTEYLNFKLSESKDLIWQKIYETEASLDSVIKFLKTESFTSDLELNENTILGRSGKTKLSSTKGVAMGAYSSYDVFIKIDFKDNKYRVTISDVLFDPTVSSVNSGMFSISQANQFTLNDFAVRNNSQEIRGNNTAKNLLKILDKDFNSHFVVKKTIKNDDW